MIDEDERAKWRLPSPLPAKSVRLGDFVFDATVVHNLKPHAMTESDRPRVERIANLARADGEPLGTRPIRLDLEKVAFGVVLRYLTTAQFEEPGGIRIAYGTKNWKREAEVVRSLIESFAVKRLPPEFDAWLIEVWRELCDIRGGQQDLADVLGVDVEWLRNRLWRLRSKYGNQRVPEGQSGNPYREDER